MPDQDSLRIIHVLRAPMGGLFRHVHDLAIAHQALGHKVGVVCDIAGADGYNETMVRELEQQLALGVKRIPMQREVGPRDLLGARKLLKCFNELQPDVLHGHGAKGGVFARAAGSLVRADRSRVARLYSPHGGSLHYDPGSTAGRIYFRVERMLERVTDCILFVADYEQRTYAGKIGEPRCRWIINHNGLCDEEFQPVEPLPDAADFLFLGELRMLKGPDLFVRAIATLRSESERDTRAVIVGDGPDREAIRALADELGLGGAVTFHSPMPARRAFALARTFVMPSRAEALPYTVLEALGAGLPVIATDVGGIPEIFGPQSRALAKPEVDSLADMMRMAISDAEGLRRLMPDGETMRQRFSAAAMAERALDAYRKALTTTDN